MTEGGVLEPDQSKPSPPSALPPLTDSDGSDAPQHHVIRRPGFGTSGRCISLLVNHLNVSADKPNEAFYQYLVKVLSGEGGQVDCKSVRVKVIDKLYQTYSSELNGNVYAFDGRENLYTVSPLPKDTFEFSLTYEESYAQSTGNYEVATKKSRHSTTPRLFKVELNFCSSISLQSIIANFGENDAHATQNVLRVLNTVLRQQAVKKGCLLVRQSYFKDDSRNCFEVGEGVTGLHGFHSSFHMTMAGLSLNFDVSMTLVLTPGPILDFLMANQHVEEPRYIDWGKAKRMLKNLRIKTSHTKMVYKISGLSEKPCYQQSFPMRIKDDNGSGEERSIETTVLDYFVKHRGVVLTYSKYMPCIDVGKPDQPIYLPIELCSLVSLQRYTKLLSPAQQVTMIEKTKLKPHDRMRILTDALGKNEYENEAFLSAAGISVGSQFKKISGRVLETPKLKVGKGEDCTPSDGRWSFKNKQFLQPINIECWAIVNFSFPCDTSRLSRELISCGMSKGMDIERPYALIEEHQKMRTASPLARVDAMFEKLQDKLPDKPEFILCVLPERKTSELYGPWKMRSLCDFGLVTQCVCPIKLTERYLTNVLLKINSKLGGINSLLAIEKLSRVPHVSDTPTMIVGMDVSHRSTGLVDLPSIAAVVGSLSWPLISRYRAAVRSQSPRAEIIDSFFKPLENGEDAGIMRELLLDFYKTSEGRKPKHIIIFRDGVSESQFNQVLNIELEQMKQAILALGEEEAPKFAVIVAQKKHHTRLFEHGAVGNAPPGTIVDTEIVHPINYDFFMCAHGGMVCTLRPVHYHVLLDEIGFSPDELQNFIHSLCYTYQRSTHATSVVAPICYAHFAALQVGQFLRVGDAASTFSEQNGITSTGSISAPEFPRLHKNIKDSMFFC